MKKSPLSAHSVKRESVRLSLFAYYSRLGTSDLDVSRGTGTPSYRGYSWIL